MYLVKSVEGVSRIKGYAPAIRRFKTLKGKGLEAKVFHVNGKGGQEIEMTEAFQIAVFGFGEQEKQLKMEREEFLAKFEKKGADGEQP